MSARAPPQMPPDWTTMGLPNDELAIAEHALGARERRIAGITCTNGPAKALAVLERR